MKQRTGCRHPLPALNECCTGFSMRVQRLFQLRSPWRIAVIGHNRSEIQGGVSASRAM